jgi:hypothetical protein
LQKYLDTKLQTRLALDKLKGRINNDDEKLIHGLGRDPEFGTHR